MEIINTKSCTLYTSAFGKVDRRDHKAFVVCHDEGTRKFFEGCLPYNPFWEHLVGNIYTLKSFSEE